MCTSVALKNAPDTALDTMSKDFSSVWNVINDVPHFTRFYSQYQLVTVHKISWVHQSSSPACGRAMKLTSMHMMLFWS